MNKKGFTLIELVIVIVIIGIMGTVAMPVVIGKTETARAAEALQVFGTLRRSIENCLSMAPDNIEGCANPDTLGITLPSQRTGAAFNYSIRAHEPDIILYATRDIASEENIIQMTITEDEDGALVSTLATTPENSPYTQIVSTLNTMNGTAVGGMTRGVLGGGGSKR